MTHRVRRGGRYLRVAEPQWENPLDGSFSMRFGKRWNAEGTFAILYLNATIEVARVNCDKWLAGKPYGPENVDPEEAPVLVETEIPSGEYVDVVTDAGCGALALPTTYPFDGNGSVIPWATCQPIGQHLWEDGELGIACRSAALPRGTAGEELAYFQRGVPLQKGLVRAFADWY